MAAIAFSFGGCQSEKTTTEEKQERIKSKISIGDDIFLAKEKLVEMGFRIKSGPSFATNNNDYYMMVVDYGVLPNGFETFKYTVGIESNGELIDGIIKAGVDKKITNIQ